MTPWTVVCQASLSIGFPRQEYWSRLPFPSPADLPNPEIEPVSLVSSTFQADSLPTGEANMYAKIGKYAVSSYFYPWSLAQHQHTLGVQ